MTIVFTKTDETADSYIERTVNNIFSRVEVGLMTDNIGNIFLSFKDEEIIEDPLFIDNEHMDNEKLRHLINEINDCRFVSDKVVIVRQEVKSIGDLVEILNVCFWGREAIELFKELSKDEIYLIKYFLDNREGFFSNSKWEVEFAKYLSNM